jgi:hypothetical protein
MSNADVERLVCVMRVSMTNRRVDDVPVPCRCSGRVPEGKGDCEGAREREVARERAGEGKPGGVGLGVRDRDGEDERVAVGHLHCHGCHRVMNPGLIFGSELNVALLPRWPGLLACNEDCRNKAIEERQRRR